MFHAGVKTEDDWMWNDFRSKDIHSFYKYHSHRRNETGWCNGEHYCIHAQGMFGRLLSAFSSCGSLCFSPTNRTIVISHSFWLSWSACCYCPLFTLLYFSVRFSAPIFIAFFVAKKKWLKCMVDKITSNIIDINQSINHSKEMSFIM